MGIITENLVKPGRIDRNSPSLVVTQLAGRIVHANEAGIQLLGFPLDGLLDQDIRELFSVELPPSAGILSEISFSSVKDGKWINRAATRLTGRHRKFELAWQPLQLGWVSYWLVTLKELRATVDDPVDDGLFRAARDQIGDSFRHPGIPRNGVNNWQHLSFHRSAGHRGGDVLYMEEFSPDWLFYFLGDVAGHHRSAEVVRMMLTSYLRVFTDDFDLKNASGFPGMLLSRMNNALCRDEHNDSLLTAIVLLLEKQGNRIWFASAGHQPIFHIKSNNERRKITTPDIPLGIHPRRRYKTVEIICEPKDHLLCYTDGLITSGPTVKFLSGMNSLREILEACSNTAPKNLAGRLRNLWRHIDSGKSDTATDVTFTVISQEPVITTTQDWGTHIN